MNNDAHSNHNNSHSGVTNTQSANPNSESNFGQYNETSNSNFNTTYTTSSNSNFTEPTNSHTGSFFTPSFSSNRIQPNHLYPAPRNSSGEIEWCMIEDSHKIGRYNITRNEWKNYFIFIQDKFEEDIFFRTKVRVNFIKDKFPFFLDLMTTICPFINL